MIEEIELSSQRKPMRQKRRSRFNRLADWATRERRTQVLSGLAVSLILIFFAILIVSQYFAGEASQTALQLLMALGLILLLAFAFMLILEVMRIVQRRRVGQSSALERRLVLFFVLMALIPTLIVAVFSTTTFNLGLEGWFSNQVREVVDNSYQAAETYSDEHHSLLTIDGNAMWTYINEITKNDPQRSVGFYRNVLNAALERTANIETAYLIRGDGQARVADDLLVRGNKSYLFNYIKPSVNEFMRASEGEVVIIEDWQNNQFRYLRKLEDGLDQYLYVARPVDGRLLALLDETRETASFYRNLEDERQRIRWIAILVYVTVAFLILLIAIWAALNLASRLLRPIQHMVRAVGRMARGERSVRVPVGDEPDEFSQLARNFNHMTAEVEEKQNELIRANQESEAGRERFNSVLAGVSSGVVGIDPNDRITFINPAAMNILGLSSPKDAEDQAIQKILPEFDDAILAARQKDRPVIQNQITLIRDDQIETLFVRVASRNEDGGLIISFDDVSDLVQAQRMAAWGDVARRIAHEIKNPLTPIRLSAERMQRRFSKELKGEDGDKLNELTGIIMRQTDDLRRIVDEFSRFARMPEAKIISGDWITCLQEAITLYDENDDTKISYQGPKYVAGRFDPTLISQAFNNIIKNALEAIDAQAQTENDFIGRLRITAKTNGSHLTIEFQDNGIGLPKDKSKLFEPYVSFKDTGTGLGLPIIKKIIEDHQGELYLDNRADQKHGAWLSLELPIQVNTNTH